jgi:ubiquinone/menaquinone biosynthesis C-methylase UbiE
LNFYARYREPYPPEFFQKVAEEIGLRGVETLLDVGCGPGMLAMGFAPFVGSCTGLDPEPLMIAAAQDAAVEAGVALSLIGGRIEEFPTTQTYDVVTIGRALHWLERTPALAVLERILAPDSGRILICRAFGVETPETLIVGCSSANQGGIMCRIPPFHNPLCGASSICAWNIRWQNARPGSWH